MSQRILIIEDETAIQSILSELLADAGYNIEVAGDGLECPLPAKIDRKKVKKTE